ncbi:uncharacterized protein CG3556 isoform X2 [Dermacentor albipictus]|uniref:uncharacterized protein CG3556 isoform X2 n=1 Tax=Dermacentor albipictus TaxID=60249 RepID=UPI0031FD27C5
MKGSRHDPAGAPAPQRSLLLALLCIVPPLAVNGFQLDGPPDSQGLLATEEEALGRARSWLKTHPCQQYKVPAGSGEAHQRTLALALVDPAFFDRCSVEALLHVRELQHQLLVQLPTTAEKGQLALHVLALSASCQPIRDPRGRNLAALLRKKSADPVPRNRFSEALQLLALCSLGDRGRKLTDMAMANVQELAAESPAAVMDSLAINVLAMACLTDNALGGGSAAVHDALRPLSQLQQPDGSFGNVHTTGLVTQALVAVDPETRHLSWRRQDALNFLRRAQHRDGHFGGLLATTQVAPLLAGRTLADLASHARRFCSPADNGSASALLEPKEITVWYSLWVGDDATNRSSTTVWVRQNATLFDVMKAAAGKDTRFRFEYDTASSLGPYVLTLAGVPRDVETGHFWLAHIMNFDTGLVTPLSVGIGMHVVKDSDHVIMWYKHVVY